MSGLDGLDGFDVPTELLDAIVKVYETPGAKSPVANRGDEIPPWVVIAIDGIEAIE